MNEKKIGAIRLRGPSDTSVTTSSSVDLIPVQVWGGNMPNINGEALSIGVAIRITGATTIKTENNVTCDIFLLHW
jgi:hypothetical protein